MAGTSMLLYNTAASLRSSARSAFHVQDKYLVFVGTELGQHGRYRGKQLRLNVNKYYLGRHYTERFNEYKCFPTRRDRFEQTKRYYSYYITIDVDEVREESGHCCNMCH